MSPYTVGDVVVTNFALVVRIDQVLDWKWKGSWQYNCVDDAGNEWLVVQSDIRGYA